MCCVGRGSRIRTCDLLVPNQTRYQTALCPEGYLRPVVTRVFEQKPQPIFNGLSERKRPEVTLAGPIVPQKSRNFCSSVRGSFAAEHNQNEADLLPVVAAAREPDRIARAALADPTAAVSVQDCAPDFAMQIARDTSASACIVTAAMIASARFSDMAVLGGGAPREAQS